MVHQLSEPERTAKCTPPPEITLAIFIMAFVGVVRGLWGGNLDVTIFFKIITRMKLLFSIYLGDYSYSFQGSSELISITVTVSWFF